MKRTRGLTFQASIVAQTNLVRDCYLALPYTVQTAALENDS